MDEMRARMRDRRLQRRARDARDAPPPPPDARGEDPPAGPGSNHDDDFSASDASDALPSRAPRGFGAGTTARAGSRSAREATFSPRDDARAETETAASYDAALRGLEADRRALREEVLRVRRVDREREDAARFERARRLELEREVARLRAGGDERATSAEAEDGGEEKGDCSAAVEATREQMRVTLAAVDSAARERDVVAREIQTELAALQMERLKQRAAAERVSRTVEKTSKMSASSEDVQISGDVRRRDDKKDDDSAETKRLERALAEERRARAVDAELRGELESVAARLAEAVALADETDRAARREMAEALSAARRDARRAAEAETEALRFGARAEDAEATCAKLRERLRLAERRIGAEDARAVSCADEEETKTKKGDQKETRAEMCLETRGARVTDGQKVERDVSDEAASLRAELVGVREDLARETSLAKSALREADEANRARDEATRVLRQ